MTHLQAGIQMNDSATRPPHARGVVVIGNGGAALCPALASELVGWRVCDGASIEQIGPVGKLTIIHATPAPDEAGRAQLVAACERAVREGWASSVEVIAEWAHDGAYANWLGADGHDDHAALSEQRVASLAPVLAAIVRRGPRVAHKRDAPPPAHSAGELVGSLIMIGVSVEGRLGTGLGQPMAHVTPDELAALKLPQRAVYDLLRDLAAEPGVRECLVWNTCARMELYAWTDPGSDREELAGRLRQAVFQGAGASTHIVEVRARDAWLHLLRTAVGLNSTMPGDAEVIEQLRAAQRMAAYTGASGSRAQALLDEVDRVVAHVRENTLWGSCMRGYTHAALERALDRQPGAGDRCLVVGGSTTSCSVLRYLIDAGVAPANITLAYRGEGRRRLVQQVREIAGEALKRLRLGSYDTPELHGAARDADFILLGVDRREHILDGGSLGGRDGGRPLTIVDFNTHPSTKGVGDVAGVRLIEAGALAAAVEEASLESLRDPTFHHAKVDAERAIAERVAMGP